VSDEDIWEMVVKAQDFLRHSPWMEHLMRPVLVDIAVQIVREDPLDDEFAKRMGHDRPFLDAIVKHMRTP
jgi:hypothetical protein